MGTISDAVHQFMMQDHNQQSSHPPDMVATSDKNAKTDIKSGESEVDKLLTNITAYQYEYKEPEKDGKGTFVSPMAQDLEKSVIGKSAVINSPDGTKKVDYARLMGASLAALSSHHKDIKKINKSLEYLKQIVEKKHNAKR